MTQKDVDPARALLKVFCLNLRFGLADDGSNSWQHRKQIYPQLLKRYSSDFYGFQEANDFQITYLQNLLDGGWHVIGQRIPAPDDWQNNVIFHHRRWTCLDHQHFYLSDTPDVPSKFKASQWPRQCTMGTFQWDRRRLTVINTHFDFKPEVQRQSAVLILRRLAQLAPRWPVILMGDLNGGPESSCLSELTSPPNGFKSALWPPVMGTHHEFGGVAQGDPIDWILYRGAIEKRDSRIVTFASHGRYPSDHFPLNATFRFEE